ncbi:MAG: cytochrome P460 family protein [Acidobacteriota bacterium]|nr:cytochrome P460 family protein [Acidobacteriota bacterium]
MRIPLSFFWAALFLATLAAPGIGQEELVDGPQYTTEGKLEYPVNYREWVFLSSGLGMTYGPLGANAGEENPPFDNVFVDRTAYRSFLNSGRWPNKTIFVLEVRSSQSKGSINNGGHFQAGAIGVEVHVKDEKRFPGKWAFFSFDKGLLPAAQIPASASCYSCHSKSGAVDTTFVQFYPTLIRVAEQKGTLAKRP